VRAWNIISSKPVKGLMLFSFLLLTISSFLAGTAETVQAAMDMCRVSAAMVMTTTRIRTVLV
jgi:hypothetical protein